MLDEPGDTFPKRSKLEITRGKTLAKTPTWHKAAVLVEVGGKWQLRLLGWQLNKEGEWRLRQKFNISQGYAAQLAEILESFAMETSFD